MAKHVISVCIFCFLCATHTPCSSHAEVTHRNIRDLQDTVNVQKFNNLTNKEHYRDKLKANGTASGRLGLLSNDDNINNGTILPTDDVEIKNNNNATTDFLLIKSNNNNSDNVINKARISNEQNNVEIEIDHNDKSDEDLRELSLKKLFNLFGNGDTMDYEDFEKFIIHLNLLKKSDLAYYNKLYSLKSQQNQIDKDNSLCLNADSFQNFLTNKRQESTQHQNSNFEISNSNNPKQIDKETFLWSCPVLIYKMLFGNCLNNEIDQQASPAHLHIEEPVLTGFANNGNNNNSATVWLFSYLAVIVISACGVLGLAVIPIMQKRFYQPLLQFLVALAVGTLAGDALLHLLPHAMIDGGGHHRHHGAHQDHVTIHTHGHGHEHDIDSDDRNMWKGFVAMLGLIFFFMMERIIMLASKWRKRMQLKYKLPSRLKVMLPEGTTQANTGERQCKHKYSSFPMCYEEITMLDAPNDENVFRLSAGGDNESNHHNNTATTTLDDLSSNNDDADCNATTQKKFLTQTKTIGNEKQRQQEQEQQPSLDGTVIGSGGISSIESQKILTKGHEDNKEDVEYTVILREHENRHHGHSHTHGHVHSAPKTMSSVAWMVVMGDGLHNFTDGMAIGAAFASGTAGGFSTAVAVFCHELPHELGDFAMLLKAGMSMKQALFYNLLSSILCLFGNTFGVLLGNTEYASSWIFAAASGMFLYIALVDMIPELSSGHEDDGSLIQIFLHLTGVTLGLAIMTIIALYEHDLKRMFRDTI